MENKKVEITSLVNGRITINLVDPRIKRTWERKGVKRYIDFEDLEQAMYNQGVEYMFTQGILGIEDMDVKIALGLEPEGAKEPVNIIILTDAQKRRYLTVAPLNELKEIIEKLSYEQIQELADFAIENELSNFDRCEILKKAIQVDVIQAIRNKRADKEETKEA